MNTPKPAQRLSFPKVWHLAAGTLLLAGAWIGASQALSSKAPTVELPTQWQRFFEERQIPVAKIFPAGGGIVGIVTSEGGGHEILYLLTESNTLTPGPLIDLAGNVLTETHVMDQFLGDTLKHAWTTLNERSELWVAVGAPDAERVIYSFDDPNCPYCAKQYDLLAPMVASGELQVRHLLVGMLGQDSAELAASVLSSDAPATAFDQYQVSFGEDGAKERLRASGNPSSEAALALIRDNAELMQQLGVRGTPAVIYPPAPGETLPRVAGGVQTPDRVRDAFGG